MTQNHHKTKAVLSANNEKRKVLREPVIKDLFREIRESLFIQEVRMGPSKTRSWLGKEERKEGERGRVPWEKLCAGGIVGIAL